MQHRSHYTVHVYEVYSTVGVCISVCGGVCARLTDVTNNLTHQYSGHSRSPSLPVISGADYQ